jgi:hypothetical protein
VLIAVVLAAQSGSSYAEAFLGVLRAVTKDDVVQYVLAVLNDIISGAFARLFLCCTALVSACHLTADMSAEYPHHAILFHQQSQAHPNTPPDPYTVLSRCDLCLRAGA